MRKFLLLVGALACVSVAVAAQHSNVVEKAVKSSVTVASDVYFGEHLVKTGEYRVVCDRETISVSDSKTGKLAFKVECKGREMAKAAEMTSLYVSTDPSGKKKVDKLLIKGSAIEHVF
jgi:hypothetical protein